MGGMPAPAQEIPAWLATLAASSEMGAAVAAYPWEGTSLGPPSGWPVHLRIAVSLCLGSRFPMLIGWGPDLVMVYNDGHREMLGTEKHPRALGAPARSVWGEVWDTIGPQFAQVLAGGEATWAEHQRLEVERNGFLEEAFFTYSYSAIAAPDGSVEGVLDVATETTAQVIDGRRLACLSDLASALVRSARVTDVGGDTVRALSRWTSDVPSADVRLFAGEELVLVASNGQGHRIVPTQEVLAAVDPSGGVTVLDDEWRPGRPARQVAVPVGPPGADGLLVLRLSSQRPFDDSYRRFVELVARTVGAALDIAHRQAVELGEQRHVSETMQRAMLDPVSDLPTVAARYRPVTGNLFVGGDWYDVIRLADDRRALVVGDCVGKGLEAATVMGQLRSAIRALLFEGHSPAHVLEGMDRFAATLDGALCTTDAVVVVDTGVGQATYSCAGHPPPLLVGASGPRWLEGGRGLPLAVTDDDRVDATVATSPGDLLVLYTDGLVERAGASIDVGLERRAQAAAGLRGERVQDIADGLLERLDADSATDDVVLVVKRVPPAPD